ncbi:MarR family transcriptional regulator [Paenibacillus doosanensis]|uniref:HTH-type transcriptional regulator YusO n=1 Tax=Paenibacillus konkukensis TaxID=2020716 RepID=A0ABY4RIA3_9BACL|nr:MULTISPECIES: MarR family transcriptional regulator [Paenibacillus]MCS7461085.1 MarR family transcriptional regulator [Paenibacillus doosanensis]UQZ81581.1 putative HTH-type transcriptional regulator YusO [Paenibacillus konkukensis]
MKNNEALEQFLTHMQTINRHMRSKVFDQQPDALTRVQWLLLRHLHRNGTRTIGQLAVHLDVRPSTMSQMIDRLEKSRLVYRECSQPDARVKNVGLTDEGKDLIRRTEALWMEALNDSFNLFTEREQADLIGYMERLTRGLNKHTRN